MLQIIPGLLLTATIAVCARQIESLPVWPFTVNGPAPHPIDSMIIAILLGMGLRWLSLFPEQCRRGVRFTSKTLLPLAIILMGARLDFSVVFSISWQALWINLFCVVMAYTATVALCRWGQVPDRIGVLVGIGTAICGGTAIVAAAPVIQAKEGETSISVTTITLFGILAIFFYPLLGTAFGMSETQFGVWAGTAIQAVPQVIGAGFAYGSSAGEIALLVKLVRILLLAPFILYLSYWNHKQSDTEGTLPSWYTLLPVFVYGFVAMVALASFGVLDDFGLRGPMKAASSFLVVMAMAGVGYESDLKGALHSNLKVLCAGFASAAILGVLSYSLIRCCVE